MKSKDIPADLRPFYEEFRKVANRHDYAIVFDDFLSAMMNFFTPPQYEGISTSCFEKYTKEERLIIGNLPKIILRLFNQKIVEEEQKWYDPFGAIYEALASGGKRSALGQFFTPEHVVDLMTMMQGDPVELTGKEMRISDPCCGSGRFLIAYQGHFPGNYVFGEDIDPICCKMTCLNLLMHGCEGEVVNHNALLPDDYIQGWKINHQIRIFQIPSITPMEKENSTIYQMWQHKKSEQEQETIRKVGHQFNLL